MRHSVVRVVWLGVLLLLVAVGAQARTVTGFVTGVSDGDTFHVVIDGTATRVRLAQVDAPEKAQPFGRRAEQALRELIWKREVAVTWTQVDRYGRPIVEVDAQGINVNAEMVKRGFAWVYRQYAHDARLLVLEREAQEGRRGLWRDGEALPPWEWRKRHKASRE